MGKNAPKTDLDDPNLHRDNPFIQKTLDQQKKRREAYKRKKERAASTRLPVQSGVCRSCSMLRSNSGECGC